ncbi:MAG TPA: fatty acid desaturase [Actinomycetes bacterium]|jgi:beta-carotene hydroxylase|nr:fatty acid desaturase [Actinomycetes bacterium]
MAAERLLTPDELRMPTLGQLGLDLKTTTARQRRIALARPWAALALLVALALVGWWWATPIAAFMIFVAVVTVTHDVVHRSLGLSRRQTDWALFFTGLILLESGHAYRTTHTQHHCLFPSDDDPEGYPANLSMLGALCYGPVFLVRLWWWAFHRNRSRPAERAWMIAEGIAPLAAVGAGVALWPRAPLPLVYATMMIVGSWVYPLLTVYLPHHGYGETPLTQTRTLRGRIIPAIFLELTYHLEHHLYPQVPSHNLPEVARRLDPFLDRAGLRAWRVI